MVSQRRAAIRGALSSRPRCEQLPDLALSSQQRPLKPPIARSGQRAKQRSSGLFLGAV